MADISMYLRQAEQMDEKKKSTYQPTATPTQSMTTTPPSYTKSNSIVSQYLKQAEEMDNAKKNAATTPVANAATGVTQTTPEDDDKTTLGERIKNIFSGAGKSYASGFTSAAGTVSDLVSTGTKQNSGYEQARQIEVYQRAIDDWTEKLAKADSDKERARIEKKIRDAQESQNKLRNNWSTGGELNAAAAEKLYDVTEKLSASAEEDIAQAKDGLGFGGQLAVDLGVAGTQLAGDALAATLTGGTSLIPMAIRSFGSGAQEARQEGANIYQQVSYGAGSAALSAAAEKLFSVAKPMAKLFGKGFADDFVKKLSGRLAETAAGRAVLSAISEGAEEAIEAVLNPVLKRVTYDKDAKITVDTLAEAGYNALIGAGLGGILGTAGEVKLPNRTSSNSSQTEAANTGNATAESTTDESGAEAIVEPATERGKDALETVLLDSVSPTARQINEIAKDPAQLARLGIDPNGKTASQLRIEVRDALAKQTAAPVAEAPVEQTPVQTQPIVAEQEITPQSVNVEADAGNTVGAAQLGFETPNSVGVERTSNINKGVARYTRAEGEATARNREDYDALFKYTSKPEAQSEAKAENVLYVDVNGVKTFLMDVDMDAYNDIIRELTDARAWDGEMTDRAMMIKHELQGRSIDREITEDEYTAWLEVMREHATATGQGVQAWAKWTRRDNEGGSATEAAAWRILKESKLSKERQSEIFNAIVKFDQRIEDAKYSTDLRDIILEIAGQRGTINGLTGKQSKVLTSVAKNALDGLSFHQLQQLAYSSSAALATDTTSIDIGKKLKTIQVLNMMSNTKTATANLGGNSTFYALDSLSMRGAALLDMALSKLTGTRSIAFEKSVLSKDVRDSITEAINLSLAEVTLDVDMGGSNRYQLDGGRTFRAKGVGILNTDTKVDKFAERVYSVIERNMNYLMRTSDEAFKGAARGTAKATQALVESGKIKNAYDSYAKDTAENLALYRTFQNDGKVGATLQCIHDVLNLIGIGDSGKRIARKNGGNGFTVHSFGVGDLVAPFTRVAANLASVGVDYSPINIIKGTGEIINQVYLAASKKTVQPWKQSKAVSDLARGLTGTAIAWGVSALAKAGLIRRAKDEDKEDVAALNQSEGMVGTQVDIDALDRWLNGGSAEWKYGDTLIDMSRLEPLNFILSLGVKLSDNEDEDGILSVLKPALFDPAMNAVETAGDLPVLSTVGGFVEDVKVYNTPVFEALAESLGKSAISSVTPNIVAAFAKGIDDKQRNVYGTDKEGFAGVGDVLLNTLLSRIPGARETLPTTVNSLGEEKDNEGTLLGRLTASMLNPLGVNEYTQSKFSQEMERLRELTGETGFYPENKKPSTLSYTDKNDKKHEVTLTYKQKQDYQTVRGNTHLKIGDDMLNNKHYQSADTAMQTALLQRVHDYAREVAKMSVLGEDAGQSWVVNSKNAKKDLGISQTDFFYYYEKYGSDLFANGDTYNKTKRMVASGLTIDQWAKMQNEVDANNNKYPSKSETEAYIEANFPSSQWYTIFNAFNSSWNNPY